MNLHTMTTPNPSVSAIACGHRRYHLVFTPGLLIFHDYLDSAFCIIVQWYVESEKRLYDDFSLRCGPHKGHDQQYMNHMFFDETNVTGVISGTWDKVPVIKFPDTVRI